LSHPVLPERICISASDQVQSALDNLCRTEDVRFSPAGNRLALADYEGDTLLLLSIDFEEPTASRDTRQIVLHSPVEVRSASFSEPHGLSFLDDSTLLVANRTGLVVIVEVVGPQPAEANCVDAKILGTIDGGWFDKIETPGSVAAFPVGQRSYDVLVCNNYKHCVTQHKLHKAGHFFVSSNRVFAKKGIRIPDGAAFSPDGRWIAISNHSTSNVLVYEYASWFISSKKPACRLEGPNFPHGVQFTPDGQYILTVDAGAPHLFAYRRPAGGWQGDLQPVCVRQVLPTETFLRGHTSPLEGGPKGLDICRDKSIVATTCEEDPLAFFDLAEFTDPKPGRAA
jgi:DNA-binding beta-propeller fold protein YncE